MEKSNYKRAVLVWMDDLKEFVYDNHPEMKVMTNFLIAHDLERTVDLSLGGRELRPLRQAT